MITMVHHHEQGSDHLAPDSIHGLKIQGKLVKLHGGSGYEKKGHATPMARRQNRCAARKGIIAVHVIV
jgi:hypothetical protein